MTFLLKGDIVPNEVQTIAQVFYPNEKFQTVDELTGLGLCLSVLAGKTFVTVGLYKDGCLVKTAKESGRVKTTLKNLIYDVLSDYTEIFPPWGIRTGIRPTKLLHELWALGLSEKDALEHLKTVYRITGQKAELCNLVALAEKEILSTSNEKANLYIGIPFCPTKCLYCSFTSYPSKQFGKHMDLYISSLLKELDFLFKTLKDFSIENIYIGGGTPTALDDKNFSRLLEYIGCNIDINSLKEYTVEAGRPDTITAKKLEIMKQNNVGRISINPQTMNDETLAKIGREHTVTDFLNAYSLAKSHGFENINIDLILGLPGETPEIVRNTFEEISKLSPKSVTVHTLSVKRASRLKIDLENYNLPKPDVIEEMLRISNEYCGKMGLHPYYMYRQKNMVGNFENVGYCAKGYEGRYNVQIMEERQSVYAAGAGAVTKLVNPKTKFIDRTFNVKDLEEYINRTDEMIERKAKLIKEFF